ncbi:MAG: hypothetical protein HFH93_05910 [Lachnospiraceae bacterium]|nr:hypothetical protein [Lachnospiraceae bacterium]
MTRKRFIALAVLIGIIHVGLILFFGMKKEGFHEDEYYSYWSVSVPAGEMKPVNFSWNSGYGLQSRFLIKENHRFDYGMVVQNQAEDVHPPLYYMALHTVMSLFPNSFYKWFGIVLNLLFSLVSYGCVVALFYFMSENVIRSRETGALLAGFIYAVAPSTVSNLMLTRMYTMSSMWSIVYALIFVLLMKDRQMSRLRFGLLLGAGAVTCYCSFLTHYFSLLIPFFLTAAYCIYTVFCRRGIVRMLIWGGACTVSIGLGVLSYPASLQHIFGGYRGQGAMQGLLGGGLPERLSIFTGYMQSWIFSGTLYPVLLVFGVSFAGLLALVIRRNGWKNVHNFVCRMAAVLFALAMSYIALCGTSLIVGSAACRYFYPVVSLALPFMAYVVWALGIEAFWENRSKGVRGGITVCAAVLALVPPVFGYWKGNVLFLYEEDAEKVAFSQEYSQYPAVMVYGAGDPYRSWYVDNQLWPFEQVFYLFYDQRDALEDERLREAEKIVVFMDAPEEMLEPLIEDNPNLSAYTLVRHDQFYYVYLLE